MSKRKNKFPYVRQGENDLATLNPELVPEWMDSNDHKPTEVAAGSHYKAWWKCSKCKWEWQAPVNMRTKAGHGCPACAGKAKPKIRDFENRTVPQAFKPAQPLPIARPDVMEYWDYEANVCIDPMSLYCDSCLEVSWLCPVCGYRWRAKIYSKCRNGKCSSCVHRERALEKAKRDGVKILGELPEIAAMWSDRNKLTPSDYTVTSHAVVWWRCPACDTEWRGEIRCRVSEQSKCPLCHPTQKNLRKHENTVDITDPDAVSDWDYESNCCLTPSDVTRACARKVWWKCSRCNRPYKERISTHVSKKNRYKLNPAKMARYTACTVCCPVDPGRSTGEVELFSFVRSVCKHYGVDEIISNDRSLLSHVMSPDGREHLYELDVYVPDLKLAFEYNGDYWHSDESVVQSKPMFSSAEEYHELKKTACAERGVQLFFVWEHEWLGSSAEAKERVEEIIKSAVSRRVAVEAESEVTEAA